jgi:hypothetical protein
MIILINGMLIGKKSDYFNEKFEKFENFVTKYNKTYRNDPLEYHKRLNIFEVIFFRFIYLMFFY